MKPDVPQILISTERIDYVGFDIPGVRVVGHGLDLGGLHKGLPYIGTVETPDR